MFVDEFISKNIEVIDNKIILSDDFLSFLKSRITDEKRYNHSLSVADLSYKVAIANNVDKPIKYYLAAILHDIGKNTDKRVVNDIMDKYYHQYKYLPKYSFHQFVGEYIVMHDLCIFDEEILNAIKFHCTGDSLMSKIGKVVYACDKIDPLRNFDSSELISEMLKNIDSGFLVVLKANYDFLVSKAKNENDKDGIFNELSSKCFKYYLNIER